MRLLRAAENLRIVGAFLLFFLPFSATLWTLWNAAFVVNWARPFDRETLKKRRARSAGEVSLARRCQHAVGT